jgi:hypothetical protein
VVDRQPPAERADRVVEAPDAAAGVPDRATDDDVDPALLDTTVARAPHLPIGREADGAATPIRLCATSSAKMPFSPAVPWPITGTSSRVTFASAP